MTGEMKSQAESTTHSDVLPGVPLQEFVSSSQLGRFLAVSFVVVGHLPLVLEYFLPLKMISMAKIGVGLFTFYSGFLLQYQYRQTEQPHFVSAKWLLRRILRIFPMYWVALILCLIISNTSGGTPNGAYTLIVNFAGLQLFLGVPSIDAGFVDAYWYVSFILGCYVLFLLVKKARHKGLITLVITACVACKYAVTSRTDVQFLAALALPTFLVGMWAADHTSRNRGFRIRRSTLLAATVLLLGAAALARKFPTASLPTSLRGALYLTGFMSVILASLGMVGVVAYAHAYLKRHAGRLNSAGLSIGGISYEIYLLHLPCLWILVILGKHHPIGGLLVYCIVVLGASFVCHITLGKITRQLQGVLRPNPST